MCSKLPAIFEQAGYIGVASAASASKDLSDFLKQRSARVGELHQHALPGTIAAEPVEIAHKKRNHI